MERGKALESIMVYALRIENPNQAFYIRAIIIGGIGPDRNNFF